MSLREHRDADSNSPRRRSADDSHRGSNFKKHYFPAFSCLSNPDSDIEQVTGYTFANTEIKNMLIRAFGTTQSLSRDFERLEWLGDSVIALSTAHTIWTHYEGSGIKDYVTSQSNEGFTKISKEIGLASCFCVATTDSSVDFPDKFHADLLEAFVGAVFLDSGYKECIERLSLKILSSLPVFNYSSSVNWLSELDKNDFEVYEHSGYFKSKSLEFYIVSSLDKNSVDFKDLPFVKQLIFLGKRVRDLILTTMVFEDYKEATPSELEKSRQILSPHPFHLVTSLLARSFFDDIMSFDKNKQLFFLGGLFLAIGYDETLRRFRNSYEEARALFQ